MSKKICKVCKCKLMNIDGYLTCVNKSCGEDKQFLEDMMGGKPISNYLKYGIVSTRRTWSKGK